MKDPIILIPAYKPDESLLKLIDSLLLIGLKNIVVVRDGGGVEYDKLFYQVNQKVLHVCTHERNLGKGRALKTGFEYIKKIFPESCGVVTVDADGQHVADDILKVVQKLQKNSSLILGVRKFDRSTPFRSKFGNNITKIIFYFLIGKKISDTQTGLRGIPMECISKFIKIKGEKYEYELNMLISSKEIGLGIIEVPIKTIYIENNRSSHFNPIVDSLKIYFVFLRYSFGAILAAAIDLTLFSIMYFNSGSVLKSQVVSRSVSALFNFYFNKTKVFCSKGRFFYQIFLYIALVLVSGSSSYFIIIFLKNYFNGNIIVIKLIADLFLFFFNFCVQKAIIFKKSERKVE